MGREHITGSLWTYTEYLHGLNAIFWMFDINPYFLRTTDLDSYSQGFGVPTNNITKQKLFSRAHLTVRTFL